MKRSPFRCMDIFLIIILAILFFPVSGFAAQDAVVSIKVVDRDTQKKLPAKISLNKKHLGVGVYLGNLNSGEHTFEFSAPSYGSVGKTLNLKPNHSIFIEVHWQPETKSNVYLETMHYTLWPGLASAATGALLFVLRPSQSAVDEAHAFYASLGPGSSQEEFDDAYGSAESLVTQHNIMTYSAIGLSAVGAGLIGWGLVSLFQSRAASWNIEVTPNGAGVGGTF